MDQDKNHFDEEDRFEDVDRETLERDRFAEEMAAEVAPNVNEVNQERDVTETEEQEDAQEGGNGLAVTGLIVSIVSLFLFTFVLAPIGIIVGYFGYQRGARGTAYWSMGIGAVSLLGALVFAPFFT